MVTKMVKHLKLPQSMLNPEAMVGPLSLAIGSVRRHSSRTRSAGGR